jgi:hypothetical protein
VKYRLKKTTPMVASAGNKQSLMTPETVQVIDIIRTALGREPTSKDFHVLLGGAAEWGNILAGKYEVRGLFITRIKYVADYGLFEGIAWLWYKGESLNPGFRKMFRLGGTLPNS